MDAFQLSAVSIDDLVRELERRFTAAAAAGEHHTCMLMIQHESPSKKRNPLTLSTVTPGGVSDTMPELLLRVATAAIDEVMAEAGVGAPKSSVEFVPRQRLN